MSTKKRIQQFDRANHFRFSNILHAQYQRKQYELVKAADATKTNVSAEWLAEWEKAIKVETELNLAHDCLAYGGVTDQQDGVTIYLVVNKRTQEEMYVKVEGGKLVVVQKKG